MKAALETIAKFEFDHDDVRETLRDLEPLLESESWENLSSATKHLLEGLRSARGDYDRIGF